MVVRNILSKKLMGGYKVRDCLFNTVCYHRPHVHLLIGVDD